MTDFVKVSSTEKWLEMNINMGLYLPLYKPISAIMKTCQFSMYVWHHIFDHINVIKRYIIIISVIFSLLCFCLHSYYLKIIENDFIIFFFLEHWTFYYYGNHYTFNGHVTYICNFIGIHTFFLKAQTISFI